jgi:hypothetical protein
MRNGLRVAAYGLGGLALTVAMSLGAFALTDGDLSEPSQPAPSIKVGTLSAEPTTTQTPTPAKTPTASPTARPSKSPSPKPPPSPADGGGGITVAPSDPASTAPSGGADPDHDDDGGSDDHSGADDD